MAATSVLATGICLRVVALPTLAASAGRDSHASKTRAGNIATRSYLAATSAGVAVASRDAASMRDRAATLAYLKAKLTYEKAIVAAAPASQESLEGLASRLDGECPGIVAGVAKSMHAEHAPVSPRRDAEEGRERRQWLYLTYELNRTIGLARSGPYRQAAFTFARTTRALTWSDRMVTAFEHADAKATEWEVNGAVPPVCADMRAWVASGYKRLSASTDALMSDREAADRPLSRMLQRLFEAPSGLSSNPLGRYEGARAKALSRRVASVLEQSQSGPLRSKSGPLSGVFDIGEQIRIALGVTTEAESEELTKETAKLMAEHKVPPKGSVVIGRGKSAAGNSYTIWVEPGRRGGGKAGLLEVLSMPRSCRRAVGIVESEWSLSEELEVSGEPSVACLSLSHPVAPRVRCAGEVRTVEAQTRAGARRVRLTLSDGRQVTSRVAVLPRTLGGPAGLYYQALQVWVSPPVSFTELDGKGRPLRTVRLSHVPRCPTQWPFIARGSVQRVAGGRVPRGPRFSIIASPKESPRDSEPSLRVEVAGNRSIGGFGYDDGLAQRSARMDGTMIVRIGTLSFDHSTYDERGDVLYLHVGQPQAAAASEQTPEGHVLRFDDHDQIIGITIVNARWLLERDHKVDITIPERFALSQDVIRGALAAAA